METALYLALGACTGLLAGLFGVGGGLIIVPALVFAFSVHGFAAASMMHMAIGTSLAAIVLTSMSSVYSHHRHHAVIWHAAARLTPGIVVGTAFGSWLAGQIGSTPLRYFFATFMFLVAVQMALGLSPHAQPDKKLPRMPGMLSAGAGIGAVSALVGIGGGTLTTPFLLWRGIGIRNAIATSAACGLPIAVTGSFGYVLAGLHRPDLPAHAIGYVYWPAGLAIAVASVCTAPLGAHLTHRLPIPLLKRLFALLLAGIAIRLMIASS
jgi:uncharacterized membrane protein YfcA